MRLEIHITHPEHAKTVHGNFTYPHTRTSKNEEQNGIFAYILEGRHLTPRQEEQLKTWQDEKIISLWEIQEPEIRILDQEDYQRTVLLSTNYHYSTQHQKVATIGTDGTVLLSLLSNTYDTSETSHSTTMNLTVDEMSILTRAYAEYMHEIDNAPKAEDDNLGDLDSHPF